jgi:hypothetical protein
MFLEQIPSAVTELKTAFEANDYETTKSIAHKIKATYIQFGITSLEQDIFLLNYFDTNSVDDIDKCKSAINNLIEITHEVVQELQLVKS